MKIKYKSCIKKFISTLLVFVMLISIVPIEVFAEAEILFLPVEEFSSELLASGEFYLATTNAEIQENAGTSYLLKIGRGSGSTEEVSVRLNIIDITAKYDKDYKIRIYNNSLLGESVQNADKNKSLIEEIVENKDEIEEVNYSDGVVSGEDVNVEEVKELYNEDAETINSYLQEELDKKTENQHTPSDSAELIQEASTDSEEATQSASSSLSDIKSLATGLKSDRQPMSGGDTLAKYTQDMLGELSVEMNSAYLQLDFAKEETEKYIEIIPIDNSDGDGDRMFSANLFANSENAAISALSGITVSIKDDEVQEPATVSFTEYMYNPQDGYIRVTIQREGAINQPVSVKVSTEDASAIKERDYSQVDTTVAFPYGITERTLNIPIRSDYIDVEAEFKINLSEPSNCNIGVIDTAYGTITKESQSFSLMSNNDTEKIMLMADATSSSVITGTALNLTSAYEVGKWHNGYSKIDGTSWKLNANSGIYDNDLAYAHWSVGTHYDYSGFQIDWQQDSAKSCYSATRFKAYNKDEKNWSERWSTSNERWGRKTDNIFVDWTKTSSMEAEIEQNGGFFSSSPTLTIYSIKPILRPFEVSLVGAAPLYYRNDAGDYVANTSISKVLNANATVLQNASNTGTGTAVKFSGDSITITSSSPYSYISGLEIVNNTTGVAKVVKNNLAVGTTSASVQLNNDFLRDNLDYINFVGNGSNGTKGQFGVRAIMGYYDTSVTIHKDYRGETGPEISQKIDGYYYYLKNVNSGLYMQRTADHKIVQGELSKTPACEWYITKNSNGNYRFISGDKNILTTEWTFGAEIWPKNGAEIYTKSCSAFILSLQEYSLKKHSDGSYSIMTGISNKKSCIDVSGASIESGAEILQWEYVEGVPQQKWILEKADITTEGNHKIKNVNSDLYLRSSGNDGTDVIQGNSTDSYSNWNIRKLSDGWYTLQNETGYMLDVQKASANNGAKLQTYRDNGSDAQRFMLERQPDGSYAILTKITSTQKGLDMDRASTEVGGKVIQYDFVGNDNQKWIFEKSKNLAEEVFTYHKGDTIRFVQNIDDAYSSSYTGSRIRLVTKDNSSAAAVDNKRAYDSGTNYCTFLNTYSNIDVYPNFDKKDNHIVVRVAKKDIGKFKKTGIFATDSKDIGEYIDYTVINNSDFAAGIYYEMTAKTVNDGDVPIWTPIHKNTQYSQETFYFRGTDEVEENIVRLGIAKADSMKYVLTGSAHYSDIALNGISEGAAWMPASGVYVLVGSGCYGISNENGTFNTIGMNGINGKSVIYKTVASGSTEYKTAVLSNAKQSSFGDDNSKINAYDTSIGTIKTSAIDKTVPYVSAVVSTNMSNVQNGNVVSINNESSMFTVTVNNNHAMYKDSDNVSREEKVTAVELAVYDGQKNILKETIKGANQVIDANGMSIWTLTSTFKKGESAKYAASDKLYVKITTNRYIGNGNSQNADGNGSTPNPALRATTYAPVYTGYTFVESNTSEPVTQDIDLDTNMDFIKLPLIGTMNATFNVKSISFSISELPGGGQRLSFGYTPKADAEAEAASKADNGVDYGIGDIKEAFKGIKDFGKEVGSKNSVGMKSWGLSPIFGVYLDFGIKNVYYTENVSKKLVFIGGGLYLGATGNFRLVQYFIVGWVPFYMGVNGELSIYNQAGIQAINDDTATADMIKTESNSFGNGFAPDWCVQANGVVAAYVGMGLCGTLGVRGGIQFDANYIFNPTIKYKYPSYNENGLILNADIKIWVDALLFSIPVPVVNLMNKRYGYYEDVKGKNESTMSLMSEGEKDEITMRPRRSANSQWLPDSNEISLMSSFEENHSTTLIENGYERADSQLLDMGNGKILLAFIADDAERTDDNRTTLMFSVYETGSWSAPVAIQNDGTADFEPNLCDAGDNVLVSWTSRDEIDECKTPTDYLKSMDVYTTTIDKATHAVGRIEKLTDDSYYDSAPVGMYDVATGDMAVYYLKSEVSDDFELSVSPTKNESVIVYMLYDKSQNQWARTYYYDNEVASEEAEQILLEKWGGQRFLPSPISDFGINDPIIVDFDAISYNGIGVYTFTVDKDNNMNTDSDRELFVQIYDFESHKTYVPIRITNDNLVDSMPQLVRNGNNTKLFWFENNKDIRYIDVTDLVKNGINEDGTISDEYELSPDVVFFCRADENVQPTFGSYNAFVDADDNLFITWLQPVTNEEGKGCQEIFVSALINDEGEKSWSDGVRLTHSEVFNDEVAFVTDINQNLIVVSNQYNMDLTSENHEVTDVKLVSTHFETVGSLDVTDVTYSNDMPQTKSTVEVSLQVKNNGLKPADGYTIDVYEKTNGVVGKELYSVTSMDRITPSSSAIVTFDWTMPDSFEEIEELSLYATLNETGTSEISEFTSNSISITSHYNIINYEVTEEKDGFIIRYNVENTGNICAKCDDIDNGDKVVVAFNDLYQTGKGVCEYLSAPIGTLEVGETKSFIMPLSINEDHFEFGYTNAYIEAQDSAEKALSTSKTFEIELEYPYNIVLNGDKELSEIILKDGAKLELNAEYSPNEFYAGGIIGFTTEDTEVACMEGNFLVAKEVGSTTLTAIVTPYGGSKTFNVTVEENTGDSSGGGGGMVKYTISYETNGGISIPSQSVTRNSVLSELPTPVRDGYTFGGWYSDAGMTLKYDFTAKVSKSFKLYAKWIKAIEWKNAFTDVLGSDWFFNAVKYVNENSLFKGVSENEFAPNKELTRAMLVTALWRAEGEPVVNYLMPFEDVDQTEYYAEAVRWATAQGIVNGIAETQFAPNNYITREQIAAIIYRYAVYKGLEVTSTQKNLRFTDAEAISEYAASAVNWIVGEGIISGYEDNTIRPINNATRAEVAAILQRFLENQKPSEQNNN